MEKKFFEFVIIGAGVAGLTAAQYGARSGLTTLLIDGAVAGGQALNISTLENFPGFFPSVKGSTFIDNMKAQAQNFGAEILQANVKVIDKIKNEFVIETDKGKIYSYTILIATGAEHRKLNVQGEDKFFGKGVSYCATCDGPFFRNKKILVIGGGDSACEEALFLTSISDDVTLMHRRSELKAQKAIQNKISKNKKIKVIYNSEIVEIKGKNNVESVLVKNNKNNITEEMYFDGIFIFVGMNPRTNLVNMLKKDNGGYLITNYRMETSVLGMYAAGDVRAKPFRQLITAASDGAIAAHQAHEYVILLKNSKSEIK